MTPGKNGEGNPRLSLDFPLQKVRHPLKLNPPEVPSKKLVSIETEELLVPKRETEVWLQLGEAELNWQGCPFGFLGKKKTCRFRGPPQKRQDSSMFDASFKEH